VDYRANLRTNKNNNDNKSQKHENIKMDDFSDILAERALLQAIAVDPDLVYDCKVEADDFYQYQHQAIFSEMESEINKNGNVLNVYLNLPEGELRNYYNDFVIGQYSSSFHSAEEIVAEMALKRRAFEFSYMLPHVLKQSDADGVLDYMTDQLSDLSTIQKGDDTKDAPTAGDEALEMLEQISSGEADMGVKTYINGIDSVSLEMQAKELMIRLASINSINLNIPNIKKIGFDNIMKNKLNDNDKSALQDSMLDVIGKPIYFNDNTRITIYQLCRTATKWKKRYGIDILFVDYIQLISGDKSQGTREREVASITRELKALAMRLDIPVIGLSQFNREINQRKNTPVISDLRESSALEHDADKVILFWRPWMFKKDNPDVSINDTEINIAKNRQGRSGIVNVHFDDKITYFSDLSNDSVSDMYGVEVPF